MQPLSNRVLVEIITDRLYELPDGTVIINHGDNAPKIGTVIECGRDCEEVSAQQVVVYGKYAGTDLQVKLRNLVMIRESDILMIL